jgi:hypothetical protein
MLGSQFHVMSESISAAGTRCVSDVDRGLVIVERDKNKRLIEQQMPEIRSQSEAELAFQPAVSLPCLAWC